MTTRIRHTDVDQYVANAVCPLPVVEDQDQVTALINAHQDGRHATDRLLRAYGQRIVALASGVEESTLGEKDPNLHIRISRARTGFVEAVLAFNPLRHDDIGVIAEGMMEKSLRRPSPNPHKGQTSLTAEEVLEPFIGGEPLPPATEAWLAATAQCGHRARTRLLLSNGGLTLTLTTRKYSSLPLWDRFSEGRMGLMTALDKFDPGRGWALSTYAAHWINQAVGLYKANHRRNVRLPVHLQEAMARYAKARDRLGKEALPEEVALAAKTDVERADEFELLGGSEVSLAHPILTHGRESGMTLSDVMKDDNPLPDTGIDDDAFRAKVARALASLPPRERTVIEERFCNGRSYQDIGTNTLRISRNRTQQLGVRALDRLKAALGADGAKALPVVAPPAAKRSKTRRREKSSRPRAQAA